MTDDNNTNTDTNTDLPVEQAGLIEATEEDGTVNEPGEQPEAESTETPESQELTAQINEGTKLPAPEEDQIKSDTSETSESAGQQVSKSADQPTSDEDADMLTDRSAEMPDDDNPNAKWYVVHTYSGHENKVAATLKQRVESEHLEERIIDVLVPTQEKIEIKGGRKTQVKEKIFPGYILVKMVLDDNTWLAVRTTQGVTSFVGIGNKPTPIPASEVATIVRFTQIQQPTFKQIFSANDTVKIVDGPFSEFIGKVDSVDEEKGKVRVLVSIFGRETPVELDFLQVQKI